MSANLSPAYHTAEKGFRAAVTPEEKIAALEEMLRTIPKHKGTEKLQAGLKSRLAKLRQQPRRKTGSRGPSHSLSKEGAGQVMLVGPPNSGKSALVDRLTHAAPEVAEYPLTTRLATPGMMPFEDVFIQLVDLPPVCEEHVEAWVWDLIKAADMVWLVLAVESSLEGLEVTERLLAAKGIELVPLGSETPDRRRPGWRYKRALMVLTGLDREGAAEDLEILDELLEVDWPWAAVSATTGEGLEVLARHTFEGLRVMRIYSKQPGGPVDRERPFTVPAGATVGDLARTIHKDLAEHFKFARVWGEGVFEGQRVPSNHVLEPGNVVEIHF